MPSKLSMRSNTTISKSSTNNKPSGDRHSKQLTWHLSKTFSKKATNSSPNQRRRSKALHLTPQPSLILSQLSPVKKVISFPQSPSNAFQHSNLKLDGCGFDAVLSTKRDASKASLSGWVRNV